MPRKYGKYRDFAGFDAEIVHEMDENSKVQMILRWFSQQFEDPQNELPYIKEMGGYLYNWGGPFDASDQIQDQFSDIVDFDTMMMAVNQVQLDGTVEWAPKTGGDFYSYDDIRVASGEIVDGDEDWPPFVVDEAPIPSEPEARAEVVRRLEELEALVQPLLARIEVENRSPPMMGHNNPPEGMEILEAVPREEWLEVRTAIRQIKRQTASGNSRLESVQQSNNILLSVVKKLAGWLGKRVTVAIDAGIVLGVGSIVIDPEAALVALTNATQAIQTWITSLQWPL